MKMPIIIDEHGDLMIFSSKNDACLYLEPVDVKNEEFLAYDSDGYVLPLTVDAELQKSKILGKVLHERVIFLESIGENKAPELELKIKNYLNKVGVKKLNPNSNLNELILYLQEYLGSE